MPSCLGTLEMVAHWLIDSRWGEKKDGRASMTECWVPMCTTFAVLQGIMFEAVKSLAKLKYIIGHWIRAFHSVNCFLNEEYLVRSEILG